MAKKTESSSTKKTTNKKKGTEVSKIISKTVKDTIKKEKDKDVKSKSIEKGESTKKSQKSAPKIAESTKKSAASEKTKAKIILEKAKENLAKKIKETIKAKEVKTSEKDKTISKPTIKKSQLESAKKKETLSQSVSQVKEEIKVKSSQPPLMEKEEIEKTKFELESPTTLIEPPHPIEEFRELPETYGDTKITALIRDPEWIFIYWEISEETRQKFGIPKGKHNKTMAVRIYDVTDIKFDGTNAISWFDVQINDYAISWYLKLPEPGRTYIVDLGFYGDDGLFKTIARSNTINLPSSEVSPYTDEEWMNITQESFMELFRLSGGLNVKDLSGSENIALLLSERLKEGLSSGAFGSGSLTHQKSGEMKAKGFWLIADAELIIYGATDPTAKVSIQGSPITLTPQGTFSCRFALPDGTQEIPIIAVNKDNDDVRQIVITIKRKTH
jgi:hypothetical protein